jgi:FKBP-type peptidyl-prolyl cis-trans isomerase
MFTLKIRPLLATTLLLVAVSDATAADLNTDEQKLGYIIGLDVGRNLREQGSEVDFDALMEGLKSAYSGAEAQMTNEEIQAFIAAFREKKVSEQTSQNQAEGAAFLETNRIKEGVTETASGLQYEVITMGDGPKPDTTNTVTVHYTGTFLGGEQFDSSVERGAPATFPVTGVISGWTEGLQLMPKGSKFKFYIPYYLAYGEQGRPPNIPPAALLVFEIELIDIE